VLVRVPMSFDIRDGSVTAARTEDEADLSLPDDGYATPGAAAAALLDSLSAVPGVAFPWGWPEADCVLDLTAGPDEKPVRIDITDPLGEWRFNIAIDTDTAALKCTYDYRVLAGDHEDSLYTRAPYQIQADSRSPASFNLRWALNQWIISHIQLFPFSGDWDALWPRWRNVVRVPWSGGGASQSGGGLRRSCTRRQPVPSASGTRDRARPGSWACRQTMFTD